MSELAQLSCGHSCVVAKPEGMATNGGCYCLEDIKDHGKRRRVQQALFLYRAELLAARRVVEAARNHWNECEDSDIEKALAAYDELTARKDKP